jgi:hypothetical protein
MSGNKLESLIYLKKVRVSASDIMSGGFGGGTGGGRITVASGSSGTVTKVRKAVSVTLMVSAFATGLHFGTKADLLGKNERDISNVASAARSKMEELMRTEPFEIRDLVRVQAISKLSPEQKYDGLAGFASERAEQINQLSEGAKKAEALLPNLEDKRRSNMLASLSVLMAGVAFSLAFWPKKRD